MIFTVILVTIAIVTSAFIGLIPAIPPMPSGIAAPLDFVAILLGTGAGVFQYLLSPPIFIAGIAVAVIVMTFDYAWALTFFVLRKIPFIGSWIRQ